MVSKKQQIIDALNSGNDKKALSIARKFKWGIPKEIKDKVDQAADILNGHTLIYKQLGVDTNKVVPEAIEGLKSIYLVEDVPK